MNAASVRVRWQICRGDGEVIGEGDTLDEALRAAQGRTVDAPAPSPSRPDPAPPQDSAPAPDASPRPLNDLHPGKGGKLPPVAELLPLVAERLARAGPTGATRAEVGRRLGMSQHGVDVPLRAAFERLEAAGRIVRGKAQGRGFRYHLAGAGAVHGGGGAPVVTEGDRHRRREQAERDKDRLEELFVELLRRAPLTLPEAAAQLGYSNARPLTPVRMKLERAGRIEAWRWRDDHPVWRLVPLPGERVDVTITNRDPKDVGTVQGRVLVQLLTGAASARDLAAKLNEHPALVAQACEQLRDEGEVSKQPGGRYKRSRI